MSLAGTSCADHGSKGALPAASRATSILSAVPTNFVCFEFATDDWNVIGEYQRQFYPESQPLDGVVGFGLSTNPPRLSITLDPDLNARQWIFSLPRDVQMSQAVDHIETKHTDCTTDGSP